SQGGGSTRHTDACCSRRGTERAGDLGVGQVADDTELDRLALFLRQLGKGGGHGFVEPVKPRAVGGGFGDVAIEDLQDAEPSTGGSLKSAATHGSRKHMAGDAKEPRPGGAFRLIA